MARHIIIGRFVVIYCTSVTWFWNWSTKKSGEDEHRQQQQQPITPINGCAAKRSSRSSERQPIKVVYTGSEHQRKSNWTKYTTAQQRQQQQKMMETMLSMRAGCLGNPRQNPKLVQMILSCYITNDKRIISQLVFCVGWPAAATCWSRWLVRRPGRAASRDRPRSFIGDCYAACMPIRSAVFLLEFNFMRCNREMNFCVFAATVLGCFITITPSCALCCIFWITVGLLCALCARALLWSAPFVALPSMHVLSS